MGLFDRVRDALGTNWGSAHYECRDCGHSFAYTEEIREPSCPFCDSRDLAAIETA